MKLLRTIRLDPSDTFVFDVTAEPGEWAVAGGFMFLDGDPDGLAGKARSAFRAGFLGIDSFGHSTLVQVVDATAIDRAAAIEQLAQRLVAHCGAPDLAAARPAAEEEIAFAASLCEEHTAGTLIAMHRVFEDGSLRETFRTLKPREGAKPLRAFSFLDVEGEEPGPEDNVDLMTLAGGKRP